MISERTQPLPPRAEQRSLTVSLSEHWDRIGLAAVLLVAVVLDFYALNREGFGNTYYAAAIKSMSESWHNFFFNSFDPGGFVTIDKPPLGFWLQVASVKLFGFNGVALMLPQALAGVLSVGLLYLLVSRPFGKPAGLLAALALAITPISVVANRNNIVDSTLVFVVLLGAWAVLRAIETGKLRWLLLSAVFVGLGFNVKMLEAYLVVPALGLVYLLGARVGWGKRIVHLLLAAAVLLVVSLSWVTAVDLIPASQRPWVGSTTNNSELSLAIGYNGLQRLTGNSSVGSANRAASGAAAATPSRSATSGGTGSGAASSTQSGGGPGNGGGPGGVGENGPTGVLRLLDTQLGGQIGWLLPLAVIGFFAAAWRTRRHLWPLSMQQTSLVLWGMWLLTMNVFFDIAGFYHTYYLVMIAPAIAALAGIGVVSLWRTYREGDSRTWWLLPLSLLAVAGVQVHLLAAYPAWSRWLSPLILVVAAFAALVLTVLRLLPRPGVRPVIVALLLGLAGLLAAPAIWSAETVSAADAGTVPRAGPSGTNTGGFGGTPGTGNRPAFAPPGSGAGPGSSSFTPPTGGTPPSGVPRFQGGPSGRQLGGGQGFGDQVNNTVLKYLEAHHGKATYLFATESAQSASPYIIATGKPVMALGGFTGSDPILTSSQLAALAREGKVKYFMISGGGPSGSDGSLTSWIQQHSKLITVGGTQLYEYTG
jgi:4-amino-4-deoxy-L-arabinose transferase-like glycosyltransferase